MGECTVPSALQDHNAAFFWASSAQRSTALAWKLSGAETIRSFVKVTLEPLFGKCQWFESCWVKVLIPSATLGPSCILGHLRVPFRWSVTGDSPEWSYCSVAWHCGCHLAWLPEGPWDICTCLSGWVKLLLEWNLYIPYTMISKYFTQLLFTQEKYP